MQASRTPINDLPLELLSYIITLWAFIDKDGPWVASSLCKHWRSVVLNSPLAWSNITYELRMIDPLPSVWSADIGTQADEQPEEGVWGSERDGEMITRPVPKKRRPFLLWLQRTGGADFSLNIYIENRYPEMQIRVFEDCIALQGYLSRLRWLVISTEDDFLADTIVDLITSFASRMEGRRMELQDIRVTTRGERLRNWYNQFNGPPVPSELDTPRPSWDTFDVNVSRSLALDKGRPI